ncbi:MAG: mechanosensitive ion channel family protein [Gemmatimonadetes bacterium]|nr:mechanosensitive ion channel family protein [Gemmatimonadota bacterium]
MDRVLYGNTLDEWVVAAAILTVAALVLWIIQRYVIRGLARLARTTETDLADLVAHVLGRTKFWLILVIATFAATLSLTLPPQVALVLRRAAAIAIVIQSGLWASAAISFWVQRFVERMAGENAEAITTVSALSFLGRLIIWTVVFLLILDNVGVEVTALLTGLGIGGIAVALAAQNILGDLFASLAIILDRPFVLGDFLVVDEFKGTVESIGLKTTRLKSLGGEELVLGNADLLNSRIRNLGRMSDRRASFTVGVTYDTPREQLAAIPDWIRELVEAQEHTRFDRSHLTGYGAYSIDFETVFYMTVPEYATYMEEQQAIKLGLHERFEREGVEFAYPTQVVYTVPAAKET